MLDEVKDYYGKVLGNQHDLQTNACCTDEDLSAALKHALSQVHDEVMIKYYGCGLVAPEALEGLTILDLGCGAGRDCYVLSQFVGAKGKVIGVDMTDEQLAVARKHQDYHAQKFGFANVEFHQGYIERLDELGLEANSIDIIISNCVINLSPDKAAVFEQAYKLLKPGGEMYFADVYGDRRIPADLAADPVLYGECLSGALYWHDFLDVAKQAGFSDSRLVKSRPLTIENPEIESRIGHIQFCSATYRLFKLPELESACEDYGQAVIYQGGIKEHEQVFNLDAAHKIEAGKVFPVCGNSLLMLKATRFSHHFSVLGEGETHYGLFPACGSSNPFVLAYESDEAPCC